MRILNYKASGDIYRLIEPYTTISFKENDLWRRKLLKRTISFLGLFNIRIKRKYDAILVENKATTQTKMLELKTFGFRDNYVYINFGEYL